MNHILSPHLHHGLVHYPGLELLEISPVDLQFSPFLLSSPLGLSSTFLTSLASSCTSCSPSAPSTLGRDSRCSSLEITQTGVLQ